MAYDPEDNATVREANREWVEYENDEGAKVTAHRVTPETIGSVRLAGGGRHVLKPGEVLVRTQNANVYDVMTGRAFDDMFSTRTDGVEEQREFNPNDYTAKEVRSYLQRKSDEGEEEEYERVIDAERAGKNRKGAFPV